MTTKPRAKKFRIRRPEAGQGPSAASRAEADARPGAGQPDTPQEDDRAPEAGGAEPKAAGTTTDLEAIRNEGLTGRQLRLARRVAQKNGFEPASDYDAVRMLRARGIDPFQRSSMLELVVPSAGSGGGDGKGPEAGLPVLPAGSEGLPEPVAAKTQLPSTQTASPAERRAAEIMKIQQELARRRRKKQMMLLSRLAFFVMLPTILAGYYFYVMATPMYATKSEFLILKAENSASSMGSLFSGTQFATNQDAIAVQSYLMSKDAMLRLDRDEGFKAHYQQDWIDPLQRLDPDASNEDAYGVYQRNIEIGYDPTEGVVKMEVQAADPETAARFSRALIGYAETRVDNLSLRKRSNAVSDAEVGLEEAQAERQDAQEKLVRLQQQGSVIDPEGRIAALRTQISNVEVQLQEKRLTLQALLDNARPNSSRVEGAQGDVRRLEALLEDLNRQMTSATTGEDSLAEKAVQIQLAQADLATRDLMLQTALERLEQARRDAESQARYLTTSVEPVASQDPSYPRSFENTILAFLIFSGIYLMISLTASILREQVAT
ncbi:capsule biosynthesis protein [Alloyangia pacifica]|uniref:capsule biosynthesis protein n=1 Tax=Alloyangia pacifica TaxID=311180 RepID=UPI001CFDF4AF|nr:capsule biosynthesis protein [Alloyangia pacifica]